MCLIVIYVKRKNYKGLSFLRARAQINYFYQRFYTTADNAFSDDF